MHAQRVAIVLSGFELGGAEVQALLLAEGLQRDHGREVLVAGFDDGDAVPKRCAALAIPTRRLAAFGSRWPLLAAWRARRALRALRDFAPDVLVPFTLWPNIACSLGRQASGARTVIWNQRDAGVYSTYPHTAQMRRALQAADAVVSNGSAGVAWLQTNGVSGARISVIRNGCSVRPSSLGRTGIRQRFGLPESTPIVLMLAHESAAKDHATLIEAWALARQRLPVGALLVLAGRGRFDEVRVRIARHGLTDCIRLIGVVDDVAGILAAADLVVHAALSEGLSNAIIEALILGRPVLGSDLPGVREAFGPHAAGRLLPLGDAQAWADGLVAGLRQSASTVQTETVSAWVQEAYAPERMVAEFVRLLDDCVGGCSA